MLLRRGRCAAADTEEEGQRLPEILVLLPRVRHAALLAELHGEGLVGVVLLAAAALVLGHVGAPRKPPLAAGLPPEAAARVVRAPARRAKDRLRIATALRGRGALLPGDALLHRAHGEALAGALLRPDDLGQGVPVLQVRGVLPPGGAPALKLLGHHGAARLRLEHDVGATVQGPLRCRGSCPRRRLHILRDLGDLCLLVQLGRVLPRGEGENSTELLPALVLLCGAHLKAPHLVDAEPHAILGRLVEHGRRGLCDLLVLLGLGLEVGPGLQPGALLSTLGCRLVPPLDLEGGRP
mmetsp:Transcript_117324/g.365355  ORF Transcript_117324/g.365355 Transcript_117324/m.365355 type:complete len:295 (+) Transcript_117324:160-1044(+)